MGTSYRAARSCGWEGNRRSGVRLAVTGFGLSICMLICRDMSTPPTLLMGYVTFTLSLGDFVLEKFY